MSDALQTRLAMQPYNKQTAALFVVSHSDDWLRCKQVLHFLLSLLLLLRHANTSLSKSVNIPLLLLVLAAMENQIMKHLLGSGPNWSGITVPFWPKSWSQVTRLKLRVGPFVTGHITYWSLWHNIFGPFRIKILPKLAISKIIWPCHTAWQRLKSWSKWYSNIAVQAWAHWRK